MKKPSGQGEPGERRTVVNYTKTWKTSGENDLNFYFTHDKIQNIFRACLDWPDWALTTPNMRALDVGVGFGYEAKNVHAVLDGETFGIDLNVSMLSSGHLFAEDPFLHLMVCSLFHIPLPKHSFDFVTSMGVLHHTFSTEKAFRSIVRYMKDDGMVLIWLYSNDDFASNPMQGLREKIFRPIIARLPVWAQTAILWLPALLHYPIEKRMVPNPEKWKFRNTLHHMRDRYTPVYAYRVMYREPIMWMDSLGMECRHLDYVHFKEQVGYWNIGVTCRGVKRGVTRGMTLTASNDSAADAAYAAIVPPSLLRRVARQIPGARIAWHLVRGNRR
jgi:ubiquinone/menaquinone biosynthesis C-methylase UbiE